MEYVIIAKQNTREMEYLKVKTLTVWAASK